MNTKSKKVITSCNYSFNALNKMKSLKENISLCDINIKIGETTITAHKVVLASCSPYFEFMFTGKVKENGKTDIELKDLCPEAVSTLVDYAYCGFLEVTEDTIIKILETADFLQITSAKAECLRYLQNNINASNCIPIKYLAKKSFFTELENKANNFIRWNFLEVIQTETFLKLTLDEVKDFLSDSSFCVISSSSKEAVSSWVQYDKTSREGLENELSMTVTGLAGSLQQFEVDLYNPLRQKRIYIFDERPECRSAAFVDLNNSTLYNISPRPKCINNFSCVLIRDSIFLVDTFGGIYCQYDIENEKWTKTDMQLTEQFHNRACNVHDRIFLIAEGSTRNTYNLEVVRNVLTPEPELIHERINPGIVLNGNCVYVCGGDWNPTTAERLDVRTKTWRSIAQMPNIAGGKCSVASLGDDIYCAGVEQPFFYKYDPRNGVWFCKNSVSNFGKGSNTNICSADGQLYAVNNKGIYRYKPSVDCWDPISCPEYANKPMPYPSCLYFVPE